MTVFAYIRVSTTKHAQTTENQRKQIVDAGFAVDRWISEDGVSGSIDAINRPAFAQMMSEAKEGDTVIVTMVDRLGRRAADVLHTVDEFKSLGIRVRVLQFDGVDVTSPTGKLLLTVMAACAEMERNLLIERTVSGLSRTKSQGTKLGPPMKIEADIYENIVFDKNAGMTFTQLEAKYSFSRNTMCGLIKQWGEDFNSYRNEFNSRAEQYSIKAAK